MLIFITDRKHHFKALTDRLRRSGIYLLHTSTDTALFTCDQKDTGAVLLDCVTSYQRAESICHELRLLYPDLPIGVIVPKNSITAMLADMILYEDDPALFFDKALDFCTSHGFMTSTLSTDTVSVDVHGNNVRYLGYPMELPPRAAELLRCLVYRYPRPTSADDLMSLCFPEEGLSISNLTVTIYTINRIAAEISPVPLIINVRGKGYVLAPCK